jgi:hypothetical protein
MSNEIETKEVEKPLTSIKQSEVTNEQLLKKLLSLEKQLVKIEQKLNSPLIS